MIDERQYQEMMDGYKELEIKMHDLYGNGKMGRVARIERYLWVALGALAVIVPIVEELMRQYIAHMVK